MAHSLEENKAGFIDTGEDHHTQIGPESLDCKLGIINAFIGCTKDIDQLLGENSTRISATAPTDASAISSLVNSSLTRSFLSAPMLKPTIGIQPAAISSIMTKLMSASTSGNPYSRLS